MNQPSTNNNQLRAQSAAGTTLEGDGLTRAPRTAGPAAGPFPQARGFGHDRPGRSPERIARAQAFAERLKLARKDPANCPRCGRARGVEFRTCEKCRKKIRLQKLRAKGCAVVKDDAFSLADLASMVLQMRREMDRMQVRFKQWQKAAHYRATLKWRTDKMRRKYAPQVPEMVALDYLSETNHAYEGQTD